MSTYGEQAFWILIVTFALSLAYELYRATVKSGVSEYDTMRGFVMFLPFYVVGFGLAALALVDALWASWVVLVGMIALILGSIFYYQPAYMTVRKPGPIDWFEDMVYTGLLFVVAFLMAYEIFGTTLTPAGG